METNSQQPTETKTLSLRRPLPKIDDDGIVNTNSVKTEKAELYRKRIIIKKAVAKPPKYDKVASMYIMLRDDQGDVPEQIQIIDTKERCDLSKAGLTNCRVFKIKSVGQHIHDWVKKIGTIWVTCTPENYDSWIQVKAA